MSKVVGLTGPIGSGKNEVAKILRRHGALVIEADEVAHTLYGHQSPVWSQLVKTFGSKILNRGGEINRKKLGEIVFSDKQKLKKLDRIVHPHLKEAIIQEAEGKRKLTIINAAVLKEIGLIDHVDEVWVVMAPKEKRLRRLLKMGLSRKEAAERMQSQASQKEYLSIADTSIRNDGTLKELNAKVQACLQI
ncbi:MAG: dephospho-CoA kinase [Candidatus Margulisiibacteriota bacterium]